LYRRTVMKSCLAVIMALALDPALCRSQELKAAAGTEVLFGESPRLVVTGLRPKEMATLNAYRSARAYKPGDSAGSRVLAHAHAEFQADPEGGMEVDTTAPLKGTYQGADARGLLWSGEKSDWTDMGLKSGRNVLIRLERAGTTAAELTLQLTDGKDRV